MRQFSITLSFNDIINFNLGAKKCDSHECVKSCSSHNIHQTHNKISSSLLLSNRVITSTPTAFSILQIWCLKFLHRNLKLAEWHQKWQWEYFLPPILDRLHRLLLCVMMASVSCYVHLAFLHRRHRTQIVLLRLLQMKGKEIRVSQLRHRSSEINKIV